MPIFPFTRDQSVYIQNWRLPEQPDHRGQHRYGIAVDARGSGWAFFLSGAAPRGSQPMRSKTVGNHLTVRDECRGSIQENGHEIVVFNFPSANATWAYDIATQLWAERRL